MGSVLARETKVVNCWQDNPGKNPRIDITESRVEERLEKLEEKGDLKSKTTICLKSGCIIIVCWGYIKGLLKKILIYQKFFKKV